LTSMLTPSVKWVACVWQALVSLTVTGLVSAMGCSADASPGQAEGAAKLGQVDASPGQITVPAKLDLPNGNDMYDFLVQDACVDDQGRVVHQDPATCLKRRNIAINEPLPYTKIDMGDGFDVQPAPGWQRSDSVPMRTRAGQEYVLKTFDFGGPRMPGKAWGVFEDHQDGFDVTEANGSYVSYVATKDGVNDNYWAGANCLLDDGWVVFPRQLSVTQSGNVAHDIYDVGVRKTCSLDMKNRALAAWHRLPNPVRYSGGQLLETVTTHHFSHLTIAESDSFEQNFYTREYGATRWESWRACDGACQNVVAANNCSGDKVTNAGGKQFYRQGCRDWTYIALGPIAYPTAWRDLVDYRACLYGTGRFGEATFCRQ
jgi:hypothetical protein